MLGLNQASGSGSRTLEVEDHIPTFGNTPGCYTQMWTKFRRHLLAPSWLSHIPGSWPHIRHGYRQSVFLFELYEWLPFTIPHVLSNGHWSSQSLIETKQHHAMSFVGSPLSWRSWWPHTQFISVRSSLWQSRAWKLVEIGNGFHSSETLLSYVSGHTVASCIAVASVWLLISKPKKWGNDKYYSYIGTLTIKLFKVVVV